MNKVPSAEYNLSYKVSYEKTVGNGEDRNPRRFLDVSIFADDKFIGAARAVVLDLEDHMSSADREGLIDDYDQELADHTFPLLDRNLLLSEAALKVLGEDAHNNHLFIILWIELLSAFRGQGISVTVIADLIEDNANLNGAVVLKAAPLVNKGKSLHPAERIPIVAKLETHWAAIGFKRVPTTDLMVMSPAVAQSDSYREALGKWTVRGPKEFVEFTRRGAA